MRHLAAAAVAVLVLVAGAPRAAAAPSAVTYRPPVDGPVTDHFRPSASGYGAGNVGIDYATRAGEPVRVAAAGQVTFAGQVGGTLHVVVLHPDGIRTSYSFLATTTVTRGQHVASGEVLGTAGPSLHFGARAGEAYLDPEVLLGAAPPRVRLVPDGDRRPATEQVERAHVAALLGWLGRTAKQAVGAGVQGVAATGRAGQQLAAWAGEAASLSARYAVGQASEQIDEVGLLAHYARALLVPGPIDELLTTLRATAEWRRDQRHCTPAAAPAPRVAEHRIVVEVAGLGSHRARAPADPSDGGAVFEVDTGSVYADAEIQRFSYRGGTTDQHGYTSADTQVDIRTSGRSLRELLERIQFEHPGVPIDLIAHSQGGLVVRAALGDELDPLDPRTPHIAHVVTLGTPHHGANLATAGALFAHTTVGDGVERLAGAAHLGGIDPRSTSVRQLAETSTFIRKLNRRPLPADVRFTSIAARGDPVVPSPRAHLSGATNVIVNLGGIGTDHARLPGSAAATREIGLAVNDLGPTCQSLSDAVQDARTGQDLSRGEDGAAAALGLAAHLADGGLPSPLIHHERTDP